MQWDTNDEQDYRVVKRTGWSKIENYRNLEDRAGVYIFVNADRQVKYVGKAGAGRIVDEVYNAIYRGKDRGATLVKVFYTNSSANAQSLERVLRDKYNPPNNLT